MKYIVIELQTNGNQVANLATTYDTREAAESAYHGILAAAAISNVEKHGAIILTDECFPLMNQCYHHATGAGQQ